MAMRTNVAPGTDLDEIAPRVGDRPPPENKIINTKSISFTSRLIAPNVTGAARTDSRSSSAAMSVTSVPYLVDNGLSGTVQVSFSSTLDMGDSIATRSTRTNSSSARSN